MSHLAAAWQPGQCAYRCPTRSTSQSAFCWDHGCWSLWPNESEKGSHSRWTKVEIEARGQARFVERAYALFSNVCDHWMCGYDVLPASRGCSPHPLCAFHFHEWCFSRRKRPRTSFSRKRNFTAGATQPPKFVYPFVGSERYKVHLARVFERWLPAIPTELVCLVVWYV